MELQRRRTVEDVRGWVQKLAEAEGSAAPLRKATLDAEENEERQWAQSNKFKNENEDEISFRDHTLGLAKLQEKFSEIGFSGRSDDFGDDLSWQDLLDLVQRADNALKSLDDIEANENESTSGSGSGSGGGGGAGPRGREGNSDGGGGTGGSGAGGGISGGGGTGGGGSHGRSNGHRSGGCGGGSGGRGGSGIGGPGSSGGGGISRNSESVDTGGGRSSSRRAGGGGSARIRGGGGGGGGAIRHSSAGAESVLEGINRFLGDSGGKYKYQFFSTCSVLQYLFNLIC